MTSIHVSPVHLLEQHASCKQHALKLQDSFIPLSNSIYAYPNWTGDSCTAFHQLWKNWGTVFNDLHAAFEQLSGFLQEAALVYEQTDQKICDQIDDTAK